MMNKKILIAIGILAIIILFGVWILTSKTTLPKEQGKVWVSRHLTQCAEEWQDWVYERNKDKYKQPWEENEEVNLMLMNEGIKDFYKTKYGIIIYDIRREKIKMQGACEACHCLSNTKLFLLVAEKDVNKMLELGYTKGK